MRCGRWVAVTARGRCTGSAPGPTREGRGCRGPRATLRRLAPTPRRRRSPWPARSFSRAPTSGGRHHPRRRSPDAVRRLACGPLADRSMALESFGSTTLAEAQQRLEAIDRRLDVRPLPRHGGQLRESDEHPDGEEGPPPRTGFCWTSVAAAGSHPALASCRLSEWCQDSTWRHSSGLDV